MQKNRPRKFRSKPKKLIHRIAVIDFETDPFSHGQIVEPFCAGFYDGFEYVEFWGDDCADRLVDYLSTQCKKFKYTVYAHNGGKFDFYFLLKHLENPIKFIAGRIVKAKLGQHELRDSMAIVPVSLKRANDKDEIDYAVFTKDKREKHKADILHYLCKDCEYLYVLVKAFTDQFGLKLTIASTAIKELESVHAVVKKNEFNDAQYRPYYFGGRVEFWESGELFGDWKVYDVNSMYPHVMRAVDHPNGDMIWSRNINKIKGECSVYFAQILCTSRGAFPVRNKLGICFPHETREYFVCSHELHKAQALGLIDNIKYLNIFGFKKVQRFTDFVDTWMTKKLDAEKNNDKFGRLFAKLIANSAYGKFAQNPNNYKDYYIRKSGENIDPEWELIAEFNGGDVWKKPAPSQRGWYDVAIAASITSAARAILLEALHTAKNPVYCDTDSIICEGFNGQIHESDIGAWDCEAEGDLLFIAGKKLYALFNGPKPIKWASKGARLEPEIIADIAMGAEIVFKKESPTFSFKNNLTKNQTFITRTIKKRDNISHRN
jgi:hypothetical protein